MSQKNWPMATTLPTVGHDSNSHDSLIHGPSPGYPNEFNVSATLNGPQTIEGLLGGGFHLRGHRSVAHLLSDSVDAR